MSLITIKQLLESVDLDFEPRWVTKDKAGLVILWNKKPRQHSRWFIWILEKSFFNEFESCGHIKLAEFEGKDWTECIYEVPRNETGKIEKIDVGHKDSLKIKDWQDIAWTVESKINELVDAVNKLKAKGE